MADWDLDFAGDLAAVDGQEDLQLLRQAADGSFAAPVACRGWAETPNLKTVALVGSCDLVFHLHGAALAAVGRVNPDDRVRRVEDESEWVVTRATLGGAGDQWDVGTNQAVVREAEE